jgi:cation transport regulator ChaC
VQGPIVITHTANDDAVGVAYPIASKLAGQEASAIGDRESLFGGLGRNGAVDTSEVVEGSMVDANSDYSFERSPGRIYNLLADQYIRDRPGVEAHGDVTNREVANVVASAAGF